MGQSISTKTRVKVFYRPVEAAVHWAGLSRFERRIQALAGDMNRLPERPRLTRWPKLRLCADRIYDALVHFDLPYGRNGITCNDPTLLDDSALTIRHIDLKAWMLRTYPDQRPEFLFDPFERSLHPTISIDAIQALMADREALKVHLAEKTQNWNDLHAKFQSLNEAHQSAINREKRSGIPRIRSESTYLNIIGGLLTLLLGKSPSGVPYSSFETLESIISVLVAHHGDKPGISERTLWTKFSAARQHLASG